MVPNPNPKEEMMSPSKNDCITRPRQEPGLSSYALVGSLEILEAHASFLKDLEFDCSSARDAPVEHVRATLIEALAKQSADAVREAKALHAALTTKAVA
jgi:hypothetical protein